MAVDDLLAQAAQQGWGEERLQVAIADRVGQVRGWLGRRVGRVKGQAGGKQVASFRCGLPACVSQGCPPLLSAIPASDGIPGHARSPAPLSPVPQALYRLKAQLDCLPLDAVAPQPRAAGITISEDTLLPLRGGRAGGCESVGLPAAGVRAQAG